MFQRAYIRSIPDEWMYENYLVSRTPTILAEKKKEEKNVNAFFRHSFDVYEYIEIGDIIDAKYVSNTATYTQ